MKENQSLKVQRTHDAFYKEENRYDEPKEMFKFIINNAFDQEETNSNLTICDFGCATGEFSILPT